MFVVMTNAAPGQDEAFNDWYDNVHLAGVMKTPGFRSVQRFRLAPAEADNPRAPARYLALYEVEGQSVETIRAHLAAAAAAGAMPISPTLDRSGGGFSLFFEAIGEKRTA
jgi:hypothetical protein